MKAIIIQEAEIKDCYVLAILKREVWNTTYRGIYPNEKLDNFDVERSKASFENIIANPNISLYIAKDNDRVIGYMDCGEPYRPFQKYKQEIGLMYVLKEYQKQGIGKKMFIVGRDKIQQNGFNEFFISCNKYNLNALEFYKKLGGKIIHIDEDNQDKSIPQIKFHYEI